MPKVRRPQSCILRVRDKYMVLCERIFISQIILENIHEVYKAGESPLNPKITEKMEKIDRLNEENMKFSEKC